MDNWSTYLRLTESMLELAKQQRWDELGTLSAERRSLQAQGLSAPSGNADVASLGRCLQQCIALNRKITQLVDRARTDKAAELQRVRQSGQAVTAYRTATRLDAR